MPRDPEILATFEKTDDGIHGVWAYYAFAAAMFSTASDQDIIVKFPEYHPMTYEWVRNYSREDLVATMRQVFPNYHARICLVAIVGLFENAISEFCNRLDQSGHTQTKGKNDEYKSRLDWAFERVRTSKYGTKGMLDRIDQNRRDVDHARRLRNCFLHSNGLFNEKYEADAIPIRSKKELLTDYQKWKSNPNHKVAIILRSQDLLKCYAAHLEILHQLHDVIQREDFGETGSGYNYEEERKAIFWHRALIGV